ncbi:prenyltransferase, partial [uncultured Duncaniella sp.]
MSKTGCWIEAMRLRTLPVSLAGVIYAGALGVLSWRFDVIPWGMCVAFALLAQVASNFANEYYDFKAGLDKAGRVGPRRGVTEGDITPEAMK